MTPRTAVVAWVSPPGGWIEVDGAGVDDGDGAVDAACRAAGHGQEHGRRESGPPILALETAAEYLSRLGYVVEVRGPARVRHGCGHTMAWAEWRLLPVDFCVQVEPGVFVPERTCPGCGSTISGGQLEVHYDLCNNGNCRNVATYRFHEGNFLILACDDCYPDSRHGFPGLRELPDADERRATGTTTRRRTPRVP